MDLSFLPAVNASLNGLSTVLLVLGLVLIKMGKRDAHKKVMLAAFASSAVFLVFYLIHYAWRAKVKGGVHTVYDGPMGKPFYYTLLISHILLAITVPVFAIVLIRLGLKEQYEKHKKIARFAWPIWFYVSVTGVVIYFMLYHFNGPAKVHLIQDMYNGPVAGGRQAPTTMPGDVK